MPHQATQIEDGDFSSNPESKHLQKQIDSIRKHIDGNLITRSKPVQSLIKKSNASMKKLHSYENAKELNKLAVGLVGSLRLHCSMLILLASGTVKPNIESAHAIELSHQGSHLIAEATHHIHELINITPILSTVTGAVNLIVKFFEVKDEHELLHKAKEITKNLGKYSGEELDILYQWIVNRLLLEVGNKIEHDLERFHYTLFSHLMKALKECQKQENITDFANEWYWLSKDVEFHPLKKIDAKTLCQLAKVGNLQEIINYEFDKEEVNTLVKNASRGDPECGLGHYNALHIAAAYRHTSVVKYFIEKKKADPTIKGGRGENFTALDCAKQNWWTWTFWQNKNPHLETYLTNLQGPIVQGVDVPVALPQHTVTV